MNPFQDQKFPIELPVVYRSQPGDPELDLIEEFFAGRKRSEVTARALLEAYQAHPSGITAIPLFLSTEAFTFFLPSLMKIAVEGQDDQKTLLQEFGCHLVDRLSGIAAGHTLDFSRRQMLLASYTPDQLREVAEFLREMRDHDKNAWPEGNVDEWEPAAKALRLFWGQFLPAEGCP